MKIFAGGKKLHGKCNNCFDSLEFWRQWMLDPFCFTVILGMVDIFRRAVGGLVWGISQPIVSLRRGGKMQPLNVIRNGKAMEKCLTSSSLNTRNSFLKSWFFFVLYFLPTFFFLYFPSTCVLLASLLSPPIHPSLLIYIHSYKYTYIIHIYHLPYTTVCLYVY